MTSSIECYMIMLQYILMYIVYLSVSKTDSQDNIVSLIKKAKHSLTENILTSTDKKNNNGLSQEIKKADALVVEATESNFELGRFITLALQQHKPVLMLQKETMSAPLLLGSSRLVSLETYNPKDKVKMSQILLSFFKTVAKQRLLYRFNFMMSREMNGFLMTRAQEHGMSKADYIRTLILQDMDVK